MIQVFGQNFENSYKWLKAIVNVRKNINGGKPVQKSSKNSAKS